MLVSILQIKNLKFVAKLYLISKIPIQRSNLNPLPFERHLEPYFDKSSQREGRVSERQQRIIRRFDG